jgi:hypothetical protein
MIDRDKLAKVLARLGSGHDPEVVAAARLACGMLNKAGIGWDSICAAADPAAEEAVHALLVEVEILGEQKKELEGELARLKAKGPAAQLKTREEWLVLCRQHWQTLTPFEVNFLQTVARWRGPLTAKQEPIWQRITDKVGRL